jgi:hypothetical protein
MNREEILKQLVKVISVGSCRESNFDCNTIEGKQNRGCLIEGSCRYKSTLNCMDNSKRLALKQLYKNYSAEEIFEELL